MKKDEEQFYRARVRYFGKNYDDLKNKEMYKEIYWLNTGLSWFRNNQ